MMTIPITYGIALFILGFVIGCIVTFILAKMNRKNLNTYLDNPITILQQMHSELNDAGQDTKDKIDDLINDLRKKYKK